MLAASGVIDPDATDVLSVSALSQASGRTITFNQNGDSLEFDTLQFSDLVDGESETLVFDFSISDDSGAANDTAISQLSITIEGRNPALLGDLNENGVVNRGAAAILLRGLGRSSGLTTQHGDLSDDGRIGLVDLAMLQARLGSSAVPASVTASASSLVDAATYSPATPTDAQRPRASSQVDRFFADVADSAHQPELDRLAVRSARRSVRDASGAPHRRLRRESYLTAKTSSTETNRNRLLRTHRTSKSTRSENTTPSQPLVARV